MKMRSFATTLAVTFGAIACLAISPAAAQDEESVTVTAPYAVHRENRRFGAGESVSVTHRVSSRGLDLRYAGDADEFNRRITYNAHVACEQAEELLRPAHSSTTDAQCVRNALRDARPQFEAAIERARYLR
jgi:UrcA family protein